MSMSSYLPTVSRRAEQRPGHKLEQGQRIADKIENLNGRLWDYKARLSVASSHWPQFPGCVNGLTWWEHPGPTLGWGSTTFLPSGGLGVSEHRVKYRGSDPVFSAGGQISFFGEEFALLHASRCGDKKGRVWGKVREEALPERKGDIGRETPPPPGKE